MPGLHCCVEAFGGGFRPRPRPRGSAMGNGACSTSLPAFRAYILVRRSSSWCGFGVTQTEGSAVAVVEGGLEYMCTHADACTGTGAHARAVPRRPRE